MQLKVTKADGSVEEYFHTKVIATLSHALSAVGDADVAVVEGLAEAITYFLYRNGRRNVTSGEIFSIINACLAATGNEQASSVLTEQHCNRKLRRERTEVVSGRLEELCDAERLFGPEGQKNKIRWEKSDIVRHLVRNCNLSRQIARTIAGMVEQKILGMGLTVVPASLIRQLVLADSARVLRAEQQLQAAN